MEPTSQRFYEPIKSPDRLWRACQSFVNYEPCQRWVELHLLRVRFSQGSSTINVDHALVGARALEERQQLTSTTTSTTTSTPNSNYWPVSTMILSFRSSTRPGAEGLDYPQTNASVLATIAMWIRGGSDIAKEWFLAIRIRSRTLMSFWMSDCCWQLGLGPLVFRKELHCLKVSFGRRAEGCSSWKVLVKLGQKLEKEVLGRKARSWVGGQTRSSKFSSAVSR